MNIYDESFIEMDFEKMRAKLEYLEDRISDETITGEEYTQFRLLTDLDKLLYSYITESSPDILVFEEKVPNYIVKFSWAGRTYYLARKQ